MGNYIVRHREAGSTSVDYDDYDKVAKDPFIVGARDRMGQIYIISRSSEMLPDHLCYSVLVDVSGESNDFQLVGKELSIDIRPPHLHVSWTMHPNKQRFPRHFFAECLSSGYLMPPFDTRADELAAIVEMDYWCTELDIQAQKLFSSSKDRWAYATEPSRDFATELISTLLVKNTT